MYEVFLFLPLLSLTVSNSILHRVRIIIWPLHNPWQFPGENGIPASIKNIFSLSDFAQGPGVVVTHIRKTNRVIMASLCSTVRSSARGSHREGQSLICSFAVKSVFVVDIVCFESSGGGMWVRAVYIHACMTIVMHCMVNSIKFY